MCVCVCVCVCVVYSNINVIMFYAVSEISVQNSYFHCKGTIWKTMVYIIEWRGYGLDN